MNQTMNNEGATDPNRIPLSMGVYYSDNRTYRASFYASFHEYGDFISELIEKTEAFYEAVRDTSVLS